ncbi:putative phosphonopyruvate decarboxylase [Trypanosoma rangeli]|uniref:Putative phosphonopyruvate decarboxylase n=1 Tax=Trypanosoma rangeli TaxID=5698 RepID=A0A422NZ60_TRYRA|nr:putative phosphonopyruvate decarboxylase [Trypanosoma rangeli]RNF10711.1 putative phosphonopyruvate decarboxylase [Trypanosoma rangeli]|eukprot:RNF10711.1 putative phosphonopyruvate decarboxylase [Trypanosoma rangeli]
MGKLAPEVFYRALRQRGVTRFFGVPDSLLKDFCAFVTDHTQPREHVITANEGNALAMAAGHHLATGEFPLVYMQNSGLGNVVNPLLSLTHTEVYRIPLLMVVGWRGAPGVKDEPQHVAQGRLSEDLLRVLEVPYFVLAADCDDVEASMQSGLDAALSHMRSAGSPYAILVRPGLFSKYQLLSQGNDLKGLSMSREEAIEQVLRQLDVDDVVVSTTGMPSREVFEIRERSGMGHAKDFLTVGCMGHCSSIAAGISLAKPGKQVFCLDGDGATIMHMGSLAVLGAAAAVRSLNGKDSPHVLYNYKHVVFNNGAHDSVGGQPTAAFDVSLTHVAKACGFTVIRDDPVMDLGELVKALYELKQTPGPAFLEILVRKGNRPDLGRPTTTPQENKMAFMEFLKK